MKSHTHPLPVRAALFAACLLSLHGLPAQVVTEISGYNGVSCLSGSDTVVSVPFMKAPLAHHGQIATVESLAAGKAKLTPTHPGAWTGDQFANKFHVRFISGNKNGSWYDVVSNTGTTLTVDLSGDSITGPGGIAAGDKYLLVEHWTLDSLFPLATQTTIKKSTGNSILQRQSEIFLPNTAAAGTNLPPGSIYYLTDSGWRRDAPGNPAAGGAVIPPGAGFTIRHPASAPASEFRPSGVVLMQNDTIPLATQAASGQDNSVAIARPIPVALSDAGLADAVFEPSAGHSILQRRDELYVYDNAVAAQNRVPAKTYYKVGAGWFRDAGAGASNPPADNEIAFPAGAGAVIRKAASDGLTRLWTNSPTY